MTPELCKSPEQQLSCEQSIYMNIIETVAPVLDATLMVCFDLPNTGPLSPSNKVTFDNGNGAYYRVCGMTRGLDQLQLSSNEIARRHNLPMLTQPQHVHFLNVHSHVVVDTNAAERIQAYFAAYRRNSTSTRPEVLPHVVYTMAATNARPRHIPVFGVVATWWLLFSTVFLMYSKAWTWFGMRLWPCVTMTPLHFPGADVVLYGEAPGNIRGPRMTKVGYLQGATREMLFESTWFRLGMDRLFYSGLNTFTIGNLCAHTTLYTPAIPSIYAFVRQHLMHRSFWQSFVPQRVYSWNILNTADLPDVSLAPPWGVLVFCAVIYTVYVYKLSHIAKRVFDPTNKPPSLQLLIALWPVSLSLFCLVYPVAWILSWVSIGRLGASGVGAYPWSQQSQNLPDLF